MRWPGLGMCLVLAASLAACDPNDLSPAQTKAICIALVGPIKYNTYVKTSGRFAGPVLAPDLKRRNQVGARLRCAQYR